MKYIKSNSIKSSVGNSEVIDFLFQPKFTYEYEGDNLEDFDNYFTDDVLKVDDVSSSLEEVISKFLSDNVIKLEGDLTDKVEQISLSWNKEDFNLVVSCELAEGVIAEEILSELKEVIIEQVAKNIDSEEVGKQEVFAIKSDDLVEFFSDKGDAEKRAEEIESESYEVVEGEVTIFVSFDELKSAVVNERAITSKREIQSSNISLDNDTKKLLDKLEKKVGHKLEIKFADAEKTVPYVDVEKFKDGKVCVSEGYLNRLSEDLLFDGYSAPVDGFIKVYLNPEIMYTTSVNSSKQINSSAEFRKSLEDAANGIKEVVDVNYLWQGYKTLEDKCFVETYTTNEMKADKIADKIEKNLLDKGIRTNHYLKQYYELSEDSYEDLDKRIRDTYAIIFEFLESDEIESSKQIKSGKYLESPTDLAQEVAKFFDYKMPSRKQVADYMSDKFGTRKDAYSSNDFVDTLDSVMMELPYHCEDITSSKQIKSSFEDEETIDIEDVKEEWTNEGYAPDVVADFFDEEELYDGNEITYAQERELFKKMEKYHLSRSAEFSSRKISSVRVNELTEQEKDDLYEIEKNEAEEHYNSLDDSDKQMLRARYGIKNAKDYVKFFIVHPNKLGDDYEFINDPRTKLNSYKNVQSSHKQIKSSYTSWDDFYKKGCKLGLSSYMNSLDELHDKYGRFRDAPKEELSSILKSIPDDNYEVFLFVEDMLDYFDWYDVINSSRAFKIKSSHKINSRFYQSAISKYTLSEAAQYIAALFFDLRSIHFLTTGNEFYTYHKLAEDLYEQTEDYYDDLIETAIGYDSDVSAMYVLPGDWDSVNTDGSFDSNELIPQTLILDRLEKIYDVLESVKDYDSMVKSKIDAMLEYYDKEIYKLKQAVK